MKPPIPLFISTVLVSLMVQFSAIAQVRARYPQFLPITIAAEDCMKYFGRTNDWEDLWLYTCSMYPTRNGMEFTYQVDYRKVQAWTDCRDYGWFAHQRGYIRATSKATRDMVDFICK